MMTDGNVAHSYKAVIASDSEAIQEPQGKSWIASSQVLLAMTAKHIAAFSRRVAPEFCKFVPD
jgi:hypothetical protein